MAQKTVWQVIAAFLIAIAFVIILSTFAPLDHIDLRFADKALRQVAGINVKANAPVTTGRRFSTSDEMKYILFGVGDKFSFSNDRLIDFIRAHISQPSFDRPRQLGAPMHKDAAQAGQSAFVDKLLNGRRNGFFIECGAADGETYSNSLFFELERNWTGLLIEANPDFHRSLLDKNRRAYVLRAGLSTEKHPITVRMQPAGLLGGIADKMHKSHITFIGSGKRPEVEVNCFPLNAVMMALGNVQQVDYMSLDVEGPEIEILRTVDWSRLHIEVITIEYRIYGGPKIGIDQQTTLKKLADLRQYFNTTGVYREVGLLPVGSKDATGLDVVFKRI